MDLTTTLISIALSASLFAWANWRHRRHVSGGTFPVPYMAIQMIALVATLVMAGHMGSLITRQPFRGRMNY